MHKASVIKVRSNRLRLFKTDKGPQKDSNSTPPSPQPSPTSYPPDTHTHARTQTLEYCVVCLLVLIIHRDTLKISCVSRFSAQFLQFGTTLLFPVYILHIRSYQHIILSSFILLSVHFWVSYYFLFYSSVNIGTVELLLLQHFIVL